MAAALLAKLKINKPPAAKQLVEIKIRGKAEGLEDEGVQNVQKEFGVQKELGMQKEPGEPKMAGPIKPAMKIIDESMNLQFDRNTFLKNFQKPKIVNTLVAAEPPAPPVPVQPQPIKPKKNTTRKLKIKEPAPLPVPINILPVPAPAPVPAQEEEATATKITIRRTKKPVIGVKEGPLGLLTIGDTDIETRLKKKTEAPVIIPASAYYMNNREIFSNFMFSLFSKYKKKLADEAAAPATCPGGDTESNEFSLMTHQQIVRDYLNLYTPYRGLLLYHGLGSGKTCSSIAIAEGMKTSKPVIVMTPASLQVNYREELKKCGDEMYKKNQYWEFISTEKEMTEVVETLSSVLAISVDYINKTVALG